MGEVNHSVLKTTYVLDLFMGHTSLSLLEVQKMTGLSRTAVDRILNTLVQTGYLKKNQEKKVYSLGSKFFLIAQNDHFNQMIINAVKAPVEKLAEALNKAISVTVKENDKNITLYVKKTSNIMAIIPEIGTVRDLNCSASGKVLLAYDKEGEALLDRINLTKLTDKSIVDKTALKIAIDKVRHDGYAVDNEEAERGLYCISMPVFNPKHHLICSVSVSGFKGTMLEEFEQIKGALTVCVKEIEAQMTF